MNGRIILYASVLAALCLAAAGSIFSSEQAGYDVSKVASGQGWSVINRGASVLEDGGRKGVRFDERPGQGIAWLTGLVFGEGTIEIDLRGKEVEQRSFLGVVFRGQDENTFEAIYFRPFNFLSSDPVKAGHSVQYVSHPDFTWQKLRAEKPEQYENPVKPLPDPNGWFHARIVLTAAKVSVFVDGASEPCLEVEKLGKLGPGKFGLFVGNNSGGDFAGLKLTPIK